MADEQNPVDWDAVIKEKAEAHGLVVEDLKREVQRQLMARLAKEIVDEMTKEPPSDLPEGLTSAATW